MRGIVILLIVLAVTACGCDDEEGPTNTVAVNPDEATGDADLLRYFNLDLPDGRVLECVGFNLGYKDGLLDCNWEPSR